LNTKLIIASIINDLNKLDQQGNYTGLSSTRFEPEPNQISERKQKLLK